LLRSLLALNIFVVSFVCFRRQLTIDLQLQRSC
jgi:hypothetical protein